MVIVQNYNRNEKKNMFLLDGLLFCYECKHKIGVRGKKNGNYYMVCNNYRRNSKLKLCTSHGFSYSNLEENVPLLRISLWYEIANLCTSSLIVSRK